MTTATMSELPTRRDMLFLATGAVAAIGTAAVLWPMVSQMNPERFYHRCRFPA